MKPRTLLAAAIAVAATHSLDARAQAWLADRSLSEGPGVRTGDLELHPGIAGEVGYDSNYFQRSGSGINQNEDTASAIRLRLTPHLNVSTLGPERLGGVGAPPDVRFRAGVAASGNLLFATEERHSDVVSDQHHIAGQAGAAVDILPERKWGGDLAGDYTRTVEPSNNPATDNSFDNHMIRGGGGIRWSPGGGLLGFRLGYHAQATIFADEPFERLDNLQHFFDLRGRWVFLPRTALLYHGEMVLVRYSSSDPSQNDGDIVRSMLGINGLITQHFGVTLMGGWATSFYVGGPVPARNFDGPIAQIEATWYLTPQQQLPPGAAAVGLSTIGVGYTANYSNSYFGDYFRQDRVYGRFALFLAGRFIFTAEAGYSRITRPDVFLLDRPQGPGAPTVDGYGEDRVDAQIFGEYRLSDTIGINTTLRYNANFTQQLVDSQSGLPQERDDLSFQRYEIWLGARWFL